MEEQEGVEEVEAPGYGDQLHVATPAPPPRPIAQHSTATTTTTSPLLLLPLFFLFLSSSSLRVSLRHSPQLN